MYNSELMKKYFFDIRKDKQNILLLVELLENKDKDDNTNWYPKFVKFAKRNRNSSREIDEKYAVFCEEYVIRLIKKYLPDKCKNDILLAISGFLEEYKELEEIDGKGVTKVRCEEYVRLSSSNPLISSKWSGDLDRVYSNLSMKEKSYREVVTDEISKIIKEHDDGCLNFISTVLNELEKEYPQGLPTSRKAIYSSFGTKKSTNSTRTGSDTENVNDSVDDEDDSFSSGGFDFLHDSLRRVVDKEYEAEFSKDILSGTTTIKDDLAGDCAILSPSDSGEETSENTTPAIIDEDNQLSGDAGMSEPDISPKDNTGGDGTKDPPSPTEGESKDMPNGKGDKKRKLDIVKLVIAILGMASCIAVGIIAGSVYTLINMNSDRARSNNLPIDEILISPCNLNPTMRVREKKTISVESRPKGSDINKLEFDDHETDVLETTLRDGDLILIAYDKWDEDNHDARITLEGGIAASVDINVTIEPDPADKAQKNIVTEKSISPDDGSGEYK